MGLTTPAYRTHQKREGKQGRDGSDTILTAREYGMDLGCMGLHSGSTRAGRRHYPRGRDPRPAGISCSSNGNGNGQHFQGQESNGNGPDSEFYRASVQNMPVDDEAFDEWIAQRIYAWRRNGNPKEGNGNSVNHDTHYNATWHELARRDPKFMCIIRVLESDD